MKPDAPDWIGGDVGELRRWREAQPEVLNPVLPPDVTLHDVPAAEGGGIECRPEGAVLGAVLHFHGGGFFVGSPNTHRCVGAWIAHALKRTVWLCPWPLAPEHVLPHQPEAAARLLRQACSRYKAPIVISGDSAGAMMALWAWSLASRELRKQVRSVLLLYGYFGLQSETDDEEGGLGRQSIAAMMDRLDPNGHFNAMPRCNPFSAGFPMARRVVAVGAGADPLLNNTVALAGTHSSVRSIIAERCPHGFLSTVLPSQAAMRALGHAAELV